MKKGLQKLFLLSVLLLVGVFTFAGGGGEPKGDDGITIGYAVFNVGVDSYETYHNENFKADCERQGVNLIQLDAQGDMAGTWKGDCSRREKSPRRRFQDRNRELSHRRVGF